jgi:hypothetical protein
MKVIDILRGSRLFQPYVAQFCNEQTRRTACLRERELKNEVKEHVTVHRCTVYIRVLWSDSKKKNLEKKDHWGEYKQTYHAGCTHAPHIA